MSGTDERINPFPPISKADWLKKVEADLKGTSVDRLRSRTPGGIDLQPLYTSENTKHLLPAGLPALTARC